MSKGLSLKEISVPTVISIVLLVLGNKIPPMLGALQVAWQEDRQPASGVAINGAGGASAIKAAHAIVAVQPFATSQSTRNHFAFV
jgi:hypothetical protein